MPHRRPVLRRRQKDRWIVRGRGPVAHRPRRREPGDRRRTAGGPGNADRASRSAAHPDGRPRRRRAAERAQRRGSPGASNPTPDQNLIDATGRAFGIENADGGALGTSSELLDARDGNAAANKPRERHALIRRLPFLQSAPSRRACRSAFGSSRRPELAEAWARPERRTRFGPPLADALPQAGFQEVNRCKNEASSFRPPRAWCWS